MRFATRAFLWSFLPFAGLLLGSFWMVRTSVMSAVRESLRTSVRNNQESVVRERTRSERRNSRVLQVVAENPALTAGLQLLATEPSARQQARHTVEDQLSELCDSLGFDFLIASNNNGDLLAGVMRGDRGFSPLADTSPRPPARGFFSVESRVYQVTSVTIRQGDEESGTLAVGERFDLADLSTPAVLLHNGAIVAANLPGLTSEDVGGALQGCSPDLECNLRLSNEAYLSLPMTVSAADGYRLRSLQSVDAASAPVQTVLRRVFWTAGLASLGAALAIGVFSSRSIVRPLTTVVASLHESARTGVLPEFDRDVSSTREIRALTQGFNQAAAAIREGRDRLVRAYLEFVGSLANALDARDPYTAGHSRRVSEYACAIARAMNVPANELEAIRVGALLHDIGKIGISDVLLQKPGRLTPQESELIQQHPAIGRRILEGVQGFEPYLDVVELHHENWNGSGYPHGLAGAQTPLAARIVKVADAYDAMTSDRPYRRGMSHADAIRILEQIVGTQIDASVFQVFASLEPPRLPERAHPDSLRKLGEAVRNEESPAPVESRQA